MRIRSKRIINLDHPIPVYDLESKANHNFVLANGCVVHNSKDLADAVTNSVWNINLQREFFMQLSKIYTTKIQMRAIETMGANEFDPNEFLEERVQSGW